MLSFKQKGVVFMFGETREQKELKKRSLPAVHISGLPLHEGAYCRVIFEEDGIIIKTGGEYSKEFKLAYNKIVDFQLQSKKNVETTMVSNPGGAIAGAMLFGAPGAMLGGKAKKKEIISFENFLVVTYKKDNDLENLHFQLWKESGDCVSKYFGLANKLIEKYRPRTACPAPGASPVVEL